MRVTVAVIKDFMEVNDDKGGIDLGIRRLAEKNLIPGRFVNVFKEISKAKKDFDHGKLTRQEIIKVSKDARLFIRSMVDSMQRVRSRELMRSSIRVKYGNKFGEVLLLNGVGFVIKDVKKKNEVEKVNIHDNGEFGKLVKIDVKDMEKKIEKARVPKEVLIKERTFEELKKIFGADVEVLVY